MTFKFAESGRGARIRQCLVVGFATSLILCVAIPKTVAAQQHPPRGSQASSPAGQDPAPDRAALEQRLREGYARLLERELRLSDDQAQRLRVVIARFDAQRRPLFGRERAVRMQLREQLGSATPDEARVTTLLDALMQLNRQRLDLLEAEQRELAAFLSPVQRARFLSLQENFRRRLEEQRGRERVPGSGAPLRGRRPPR